MAQIKDLGLIIGVTSFAVSSLGFAAMAVVDSFRDFPYYVNHHQNTEELRITGTEARASGGNWDFDTNLLIKNYGYSTGLSAIAGALISGSYIMEPGRFIVPLRRRLSLAP